MNFTPKKDEELHSSFELFPKGEYDFDVVKAEEQTSSKGNEMIKLEIDIYDPNGRKSRVFDYLLESVAYKLKHFCITTGLTTEYEAGNLTAEMCLNRSGRCMIGIQQDKTGKYDDKNIVKDYCGVAVSAAKLAEDDIPF